MKFKLPFILPHTSTVEPYCTTGTVERTVGHPTAHLHRTVLGRKHTQELGEKSTRREKQSGGEKRERAREDRRAGEEERAGGGVKSERKGAERDREGELSGEGGN